MADNPLVVALLREFCDEALITRTEAGRMLGLNRNQVAGICGRNKIEPWPQISKEISKKRSCCFPVGQPDTPEFRLCGRRKAPGHSLLCAEHEGKKWVPQAKILALSSVALVRKSAVIA